MAADQVMIARGRLANARKLFAHRGWDELPQNERGERILAWGADHAWVANPTNPKRSVRNWCRRWAPWLTHTELNDIVAEAMTSNKRWSGDHSAMVLEITVRDREALQLWFLGADDDPHFEHRLKLKRAKGAARARKFRAARSTGRPRGRPKREMPAWKVAGYSSKRTYQRHKALGILRQPQNGTENASRHISKNRKRDVISVPSEAILLKTKVVSAERLKRDGADHRPIVLEGEALPPETGGFALAAPPSPIDRISPAWTVT